MNDGLFLAINPANTYRDYVQWNRTARFNSHICRPTILNTVFLGQTKDQAYSKFNTTTIWCQN